MFLDKDKTRPLLYRVARQCFIDLQTAVGVAEGEHAGLHGLRVAGYNRTKAGLGADMAQAHGGWASRAHERYARFALADVTSMFIHALEIWICVALSSSERRLSSHSMKCLRLALL